MHDRIIGLYEENAEAWDRLRGRKLAEQSWMERFVSGFPEGASILDIGCGSGEPISRFFVERGFAVTGIDSSPSLIAMCRTRFPTQRWLVGDMREMSIGESFDAILAWHSFFHLHVDDQRAMFARFATHARPGTILMFTSGSAHGEAIGEWEGETLYHASLAPEEYRELLAANAFAVESYTPGEPVANGPTVWLARQINPASGLDGSA